MLWCIVAIAGLIFFGWLFASLEEEIKKWWNGQ